ncbi:hypothetical protein HG537_0G00110 [Torulaspora globosa]|uniref:Helicase ATP-binding domain-containing protein n=1 Tax=Torulaspora globosa TaxID=48254 RepID=A0A7H9HVK0_9SACH|nr:hypothetical protein HG537_0G00110 [Torulaspora sp. CBS 2947]
MQSLTHEVMANHSVMTAFSTYAVNSYSLSSASGSKAIQLQEECSRRWIAWLQLEGDSLPLDNGAAPTAETSVQSYEHSVEPKSFDDLLDAGRKLFRSKFEFRNRSQERLCNEAYLSERASIVVHAPTGFGKTEVFHLPLVALASKKSCKYVSFVFVPYLVLLEGTLQRLNAGNLLNVAQVKQFVDVGYDGLTDVYVGVYEDLAREDFAARIVGLESFSNRNVKLCYLIIDEFHNLETETYRSAQLDLISTVRMDVFQKVVFLSGTAPKIIANTALRKIKFKGLETPELPVSSDVMTLPASSAMKSLPTRMYDLVTEVPLGHVHKEVRTVADPYLEAFKLLKALFACEPNAKAIAVVGTRQKVVELADDWEREFRLVWAHAKIPTDQKIKRAAEFLSHEDCQVMGTRLMRRMVIMIDCRPSIIEFIQAAGRLRSHGLFYLLNSEEPKYANEASPVVPLVGSGCLREQMARFYGLATGHEAPLPAEAQNQLVKLT